MLKNNLKNLLIESFYDRFSEFSKSKNYLFIGRVTPWDSENSPPVADDSLNEEFEAWRNMLLCKSLSSNDVVFILRRINWEHGKIFPQYDDSVELYSDDNVYDFYVYTSDKNVYKCIFNNNNAISEYEPSGISTDNITTQDGYIWKYMYSVRPELEDFITEEYIPVDVLDELFYTDLRSLQLTTQQDAKLNKDGAISSIEITQIGATYPFAIDYESLETDETAHRVQENVSIGSYTITLNPLSNVSRINHIYENDYVIYINSGTGSGQLREIINYNGTTCSVRVSLPFSEEITAGSYYKILPKVVITGDGADALAIPVLNPVSKLIERINVLYGGRGYRKATVEIKTKKTEDIDLTKARAILTPKNGHGYSAAVELGCRKVMIKSYFDKEEIQSNNFYNDYRQVGLIQDIELINDTTPKQKYTLEIENINATTAMTLDGNYSTFITTLQNNPNLIVKQGSDDNVGQAQGTYLSFDQTTKTLILKTVNGKFMNYPSSTVYPLVIEDYPATGTDTYFTPVNITNTAPLNYYSDLTFNLNDIILGEDSKTTAIVLDWKPTFFGTDGKLTVTDLKGVFNESYYNDAGTLINGERLIGFSDVNMSTGLTGFTSDKVGIIKNTSKIGLTQGKTSYRTTTVLVFNSQGLGDFSETDFSEDDLIKQGVTNATGIVVSWKISDDKQTGTLILTGVDGNFEANVSYPWRISKFVGGEFITSYKDFDILASNVLYPEVTRYSGKMLYIENIRPVVRGDDQIEEFKIIIGL